MCLIILDFSIGRALEFFYFKQKKGKLYNVTVALEKQTCDVLIFGSSRAMHHYNPEIISDSLKLTCYNVGYDGQSILYCKGALDIVLERYTPKIIIWDINHYDFMNERQTSYDLLSVLNPYVKRHPALWQTLSLKSKTEKIKHLSSIYPYNSMLVRIVSGNMSGKTKDDTNNGFTPQDGIWKENMDSIYFSVSSLDKNKMTAFEDIYSICSKKHIRLYVVISPIFQHIIDVSSNSSLSYLVQTCDSFNIPLLNFINDKNYLDRELFLNVDHLNTEGADVFSKDVSHRILSIKPDMSY